MSWSIRTGLVLVASSLTVLPSTAAPMPEYPALLAPYVQGGEFDPGDFGWLKPYVDKERLSDAEALDGWLAQRKKAATQQVTSALRAAKISAPALKEDCFADLQCAWVDRGKRIAATFADVGQLEASLAKVRPYVDGYRYAVQNADELIDQSSDKTLGSQLRKVVFGDELLSSVFGMDEAKPPLPLSKSEIILLKTFLGFDSVARRRKNTELLRVAIAKNGWPKTSDVGPDGARAALVVIQHSDHDPLFQAQTLEKIAKMAIEGEVPSRFYAFLFDRVKLRLSGVQRYGTQFVCTGGKYTPGPLEDQGKLNEIRASVQLPSIEEYSKGMPSSC